jgi:uncharacterized protein DUF3224
MMRLATGGFSVKLGPQGPDAHAEPALGRMSIDKHFHGDLDGASRGQMLTAGTQVKGSAVYVAVEKFTGTLHGKSGTFMLHHTGIMNRGSATLTVAVVPDSGTGELSGISGQMRITIADGSHRYEFDYSTPA